MTFNTPKPLIRVHGQIDAFLAAGIDEIYIVRGYLGEQFDQLLYKYPMIKFIENPAYNDANNISSIMCARYLLQNSYVFEADILIKRCQYQSNILGFFCERSDDWCFEVENGFITSHKVGGINYYQQVGIYYINAFYGSKLSEDINKIYLSPGCKELFWEQTAFKIFREHYNVAIRECKREDFTEIDSFKELKAIDSTYDI